MNVIISLATNDDHGNDTGRVSAIQLGNGGIDLQWGEIGSEPRYSVRGGLLHLSRRRFKILGGKHEWVGNWCWSAVTMTAQETARFLNYLSLDDRWHCEGGLCDLTDAYAEAKVTPELLADVDS